MGFSFKKFGQKATSVARFGSKVASSVAFGGKKVGAFMSRITTPVSDLATVGASVAMSLGQPELAVPLVGISKSAQRMAVTGRKITKNVDKGEKLVGDIIEKPSVARKRQQQIASGPSFESGTPAVSSRTVSSRTVSSPPRQEPVSSRTVKFESSKPAPASEPVYDTSAMYG